VSLLQVTSPLGTGLLMLIACSYGCRYPGFSAYPISAQLPLCDLPELISSPVARGCAASRTFCPYLQVGAGMGWDSMIVHYHGTAILVTMYICILGLALHAHLTVIAAVLWACCCH
jgi:hypothetical protein